MKSEREPRGCFKSLLVIILVLPITFAAILPVHPQSIKQNLTTRPSMPPGIRCYIPGPSAPHPGVDLRTCRSTLTHMLEAPGADKVQAYHATRYEPVILSRAPCAISMDRSDRTGVIYISNMAIVKSVHNILGACQHWSLGGWEVLRRRYDWILIVDGEGSP